MRKCALSTFRETAIPLKSDLKNSSIDFSEMTTSVVAVITDVIRDGKPVAGFAFNSTGRYACGAQMRARFIPRILKADPKSLMNEAGDNLDPEKILAVMMRNEKSGGHSERSVGIGTIEVAVWDAIAKIEGKPLHRVLAERYNGGKVFGQGVLLRRRRLVRAGQNHQGSAGRDAPHLDSGYTMVKMKVGGATLPEDISRIEAGESHRRQPRRACGRRQFEIRARRGDRLCQGDVALQAALVRGAVRPARLRGAEGHFRRL
jgi:L-alanine-DL-glutamate epimerase-like enolase superfamily enzyme